MNQENQEESISIKDTQNESGESRRIYKYQGYSRWIKRIKKNKFIFLIKYNKLEY